MSMMLTIASREFRTLFLSPLAWTVLAILQCLLAYLFLTQVETFNLIQPKLATIEGAPGLTDIVVTPLYGNAAIILLLVTPLLTMRVSLRRTKEQNLVTVVVRAYFQCRYYYRQVFGYPWPVAARGVSYYLDAIVITDGR